jgi:hypothetical protein
MAYGFQSSAYQNNAFQNDDGPPIPPTPVPIPSSGGGGAGGLGFTPPKTWHSSRYKNIGTLLDDIFAAEAAEKALKEAQQQPLPKQDNAPPKKEPRPKLKLKPKEASPSYEDVSSISVNLGPALPDAIAVDATELLGLQDKAQDLVSFVTYTPYNIEALPPQVDPEELRRLALLKDDEEFIELYIASGII